MCYVLCAAGCVVGVRLHRRGCLEAFFEEHGAGGVASKRLPSEEAVSWLRGGTREVAGRHKGITWIWGRAGREEVSSHSRLDSHRARGAGGGGGGGGSAHNISVKLTIRPMSGAHITICSYFPQFDVILFS
jgi:hypothetical protein